MTACPCGAEVKYDACCGPLHKGLRTAKTAEELMRSRYSAYVQGETEYLIKTIHPGKRDEYDVDSMRKWSENAEWEKLEIISRQDGSPEDDEGEVEFIAHFAEEGEKKVHYERAHFVKENGLWYFESGEFAEPQPLVRAEPKVGRNDPCPCGSNKKYKKCCGK